MVLLYHTSPQVRLRISNTRWIQCKTSLNHFRVSLRKNVYYKEIIHLNKNAWTVFKSISWSTSLVPKVCIGEIIIEAKFIYSVFFKMVPKLHCSIFQSIDHNNDHNNSIFYRLSISRQHKIMFYLALMLPRRHSEYFQQEYLMHSMQSRGIKCLQYHGTKHSSRSYVLVHP